MSKALNMALHYAGEGFRVLPWRMKNGDKVPFIEGWQENATNDEATVRSWWTKYPGANVGILCGLQPNGINLLLFDVDVKNEAGGLESVQRFIEAHGAFPKTCRNDTPSGGQHMFFRWPADIKAPTRAGVRAGIDTRGAGGWAAMPPSVVNGVEYRGHETFKASGIAPAPRWLVEALTPKQKRQAAGMTPRADEPMPDTFAYMVRKYAKVSSGRRNAAGFELACQLRDNGAGIDEAAPYMWEYQAEVEGAGDHPYTREEAEASLRQAYAQPAREPWSKPGNPGGDGAPSRPAIDVPPAGFSSGVAAYAEKAEAAASDGGGSLLDAVLASIKPDTERELMYQQLAAAIAPIRVPDDEKAARDRVKKVLGDQVDLNTLTHYTGLARIDRKKKGRLSRIEEAGKPTIWISGRDPEDVVNDAVEALVSWNSPPVIFTRSDDAVVIRTDENGRPYVSTATPELLDNRMQEAASFVVETDKQIKPAQLPMRFIRQIPTIEPSPFPSLRGIIEAPFMRKDGTILETAGYDQATSLYYVPPAGFTMPAVPSAPSPDDLAEAVRVLDDVIDDFKFSDKTSRANFFGLLLTPLLRPFIDSSVMMGCIDAPTRGSGKTLLASIVSVVTTGRRVETMTMPETEEEWRKQITSQLMKGGPLIVVDNIKGRLSSAALEQALTSDTWTDRVLGTNRQITLPQRAVWVATGNNLAPYGDMVRRVFVVRLDPETAQPWMREDFKYPDLMAHVERERGRIVWALLTMARAWFVAGQPSGPVRVGSFERWSSAIGGILANAGVPGFLSNLRALYESTDDEDAELYAILSALHACFGDESFLSAGVDDVIKEGLMIERRPRDINEKGIAMPRSIMEVKAIEDAQRIMRALPERLSDRARRGDSIGHSLGKTLGYKKDRRVNGPDGTLMVRAYHSKDKAKLWKVYSEPTEFREFTEDISTSTRNLEAPF